MTNIPRIPLGAGVEAALDWMTTTFSWATRAFSTVVQAGINSLEDLLGLFPPLILIALFAALAWKLTGRKLAIFTSLGLLFIWNIGLWSPTLATIALVVVATAIAVAMGLPLGILAALNDTFYSIIKPILDFMQTMPAFVYLIPAIPFFGLGQTSAVFATVIFSIPPTIRLTALGIRQIDKELIEASDAFGSTTRQKLFKVQMPLALPTIMAGVNQTIMLALSMVVIAAMIGAGGLGSEVWRAIQRLRPGQGFEAGVAVVIIAMILDRMSASIASQKREQ
ncbi:glycine betaine/proline transport system permease protein [Alkalispirochaeta americana]|uniref:Glycine betaine/proline transport system permease protein n=1 Tax=Alkalispirochaeta americana TaxID=159291 RepID=A0A1N6U070_9SPIO|nr:proline/glycine betaine ABC transporter permease [Alkalispirochaeta americana]SIQ59012.1 glycine betaine/proline transport system permease protein [Alkalispirochaeta americana]